jgi:hypothetical protein
MKEDLPIADELISKIQEDAIHTVIADPSLNASSSNNASGILNSFS